MVCRQLGYGDFGIGWRYAKFGEGSDPIWLDNVDCTGSEQHIEDCVSNNFGEHNCEHNEDASVSCGTGIIRGLKSFHVFLYFCINTLNNRVKVCL